MDPGIRFSQIKDVFYWILGRGEEEAIKRSEREREMGTIQIIEFSGRIPCRGDN